MVVEWRRAREDRLREACKLLMNKSCSVCVKGTGTLQLRGALILSAPETSSNLYTHTHTTPTPSQQTIPTSIYVLWR